MDIPKCTSSSDAHVLSKARFTFTNKVHLKAKVDGRERPTDPVNEIGADIDLKEVYFLIMHFLSDGPCQQTCEQFRNELMEHQLLPRRYHAGFPRNAVHSEDDNGISSPLSYSELVERYPHIEKDHLVKLLKQLILSTASPLHGKVGRNSPSAADVPTLLGTGSFSLLDSEKNAEHKHVKPLPTYMRWPHTQVDQVRGLSLREIGGGFTKHHRPPSLRSACYVIAKPSTMVQKMETTKQLRGHRDAVYCAIFDRSGRYVITGSDDRLVKIWSMDTALCLTSCRGHEGDITDLAVSSNNDLVASAANDFVIRVWRLPDGLPISVLRGHTGAVTAIAFSPRHCYNLLSSSDDGTCRIWDVKSSQSPLGIYVPKPADAIAAGRSSGASSNGTSSTNAPQSRQILCCAYNAMGTVFVTGSSDTYARVWDACRFRTTDSGQPIHEMGILSGHENDVNYVQFSGCAVVSRSSTPKDNISSKKDLLCCDNIVTCSRDGSAIIWVPRLRRCHGKPERCWIRAYHLKVPPPPLLPQRPRGGPRQRLLPTPRGVNMIVWSLDDRFVLAAIMDCRICVWNAIDGSLVHSLTGHRASSYVLDVHPFNPRIAMSAGYDGLTIVWDIWEGTPIRIFEIGGYKLVDGKFSPDGTSIVLSDDVGQIYLISTGQGEFCKDAKYDQFFLGDYRPLIRDPAGNVLDQETQLTPYQRNGEDLLCDSSMIPYPEPYQSMYQQRRFGALCKTRQRQASSMKFAIGLDIRLDHDYEMPPLADLQGMIEPIPEFLDAMYFEPENEVMSDNNDSEYNVPEEFFSEGEQGGKSASSFSDSECSTEDSDVEHIFKDGLRRSGRRNHSTEIESMTSSKRRAKKRNLEDRAGSTSRSNRTKRSKFGRAVSKRKSSKASTVRPQRVAALNALNMFAHTSGTSAGEDEDDSEDGSSGSESVLHYSNIQLIESDKELQNRQWKCTNEERPPLQFEDVPKHPDTQSNIGNRKRLVFKISLRDSKKSTPSEEIRPKCDDAVDLACPSFMSQEANERIGATSKDPRSSFADAIDLELSQNCNNDINGIDAQNETKVKQEQDVGKNKGLCFPNDAQKCTPLETSEQDNHRYKVKQEQDVEKNDEILNKKYEDLPGSSSFRDHDSLEKDKEVGTNNSYESKPNPPPKSTKLTIKIKSPSKLKFVHAVDSLTTANSAVSSSQSLHPEVNVNRHDVHKRGKSHKARTNFDDLDVGMEGSTSNAGNHFDSGMKLPETARRTRSMMGSTSREPSAVNHSYNVRGGYELRTSVNADQITTEEWMGNAKLTVRSRSSRSGQGGYYDNNPNYSYQRESSHPPPKASWLMLSEIEEGYRYIPQLGDEVIYLRQGHEQYISSSNASSDSPPWELFRGKNIGAVEICKLEEIEYLVIQGSGDSGCKITLKFVDPASSVYNESFKLTLPELVSTPDFVIEKTLYDAAIERQWTVGDTCKVWWWNEAGDGTGTWWDGAIVSSNPNSPEFSNSPWERYEVRYKDGNTTPHGPWELHDPDVQFQWPHIDCESINKLLNLFAKLEKSASKNQDRYGFQKLNQVAQKSDFINSFPVPLYPEVIRLRLKNKYYRTMEAVNHDIKVMLANAEKYFERSTELSSKVKRLSGWFRKKLSKFS